MLRSLDLYYDRKEEPIKGCLMALRAYILNADSNLSEAMKYGMPFFCYRGKMFCYLWTDKKTHQPYIGFVEGRKMDHPDLIQGDRKRMKILYIDPNQDLPLKTLKEIFSEAINVASLKK